MRLTIAALLLSSLASTQFGQSAQADDAATPPPVIAQPAPAAESGSAVFAPAPPAGDTSAAATPAPAASSAPPVVPPKHMTFSEHMKQLEGMIEGGGEKGEVRWRVENDGDGKFRVLSGSPFSVEITTKLDSDTAAVGDNVAAKLTEDFRINDLLVAPAGCAVHGIVTSVQKTRKVLDSGISESHWMNPNGYMGIKFDSITIDGKPLPISAKPARGAQIQQTGADRVPTIVDKKGEITVKNKSGDYIATSAGMGLLGAAATLAMEPAGLLVAPALGGMAGMMDPDYAMNRHVKDDEEDKKSKGFMMGAVGGLPGGALVTSSVNHGDDVDLEPGDKLTLELTQDLSYSAAR